MNTRTFLVLVSALLVTLALLYSSLEKKQNIDQELLLPGLATIVNEIDQIKLSGAGRTPIATLQRTDAGWTVKERFGYPADLGRIRQNVLTLAGARLVEEKTNNPELYSRLGVEDVDSEDATGIELTIGAPTETTTLIVGETGVQGDNAYVRRAGEARSWLVNADLDLGRNTNDWLASEFLDIAPVSVQAVTVTLADQSRLRIEKAGPDEDVFAVADIPEGRELSYASVASGVGSVLSALSFDDVLPVSEVSLAGVVPVTSRFECFDGLVVKALTYETEDTIWTAFEFATDAALAARFRDADADAEDARVKDETVIQHAAELNQRLAPWLYKLPSYKSDQFMKRMEDLLKPAA